MASRKALLIAVAAMAVVVVVVGALLPATASADNYVVGDDRGWSLGVDYDHWARGKDFKVGDTLQFVYSTEDPTHTHDVLWVDEATYQACALLSSNPTRMSSGSGNDSVLLTGAGLLLFICGFHCQLGMKLAINVQ